MQPLFLSSLICSPLPFFFCNLLLSFTPSPFNKTFATSLSMHPPYLSSFSLPFPFISPLLSYKTFSSQPTHLFFIFLSFLFSSFSMFLHILILYFSSSSSMLRYLSSFHFETFATLLSTRLLVVSLICTYHLLFFFSSSLVKKTFAIRLLSSSFLHILLPSFILLYTFLSPLLLNNTQATSRLCLFFF